MLLMIGQGVGAFTFSPLADRFGRKPIHVGCHILLFLFALTMALQPSFYVTACLKLAIGTVQQVGSHRALYVHVFYQIILTRLLVSASILFV
jgi:MFS family permease